MQSQVSAELRLPNGTKSMPAQAIAAKKALDSVSSAGTNLPKASTLQPDSSRKKKAPKKTSTVHNGLCCFVATADTVDMCRHTVVRDRFFRK
jgi:hypothetical protein